MLVNSWFLKERLDPNIFFLKDGRPFGSRSRKYLKKLEPISLGAKFNSYETCSTWGGI
jgi:hypothetical protein